MNAFDQSTTPPSPHTRQTGKLGLAMGVEVGRGAGAVIGTIVD